MDLRPQGSGTPLRSLSCQSEGIALPPGGPFTASGVNLVLGPCLACRARALAGWALRPCTTGLQVPSISSRPAVSVGLSSDSV
jgi:hypothetical protein